jgi:hypothetical protein
MGLEHVRSEIEHMRVNWGASARKTSGFKRLEFQPLRPKLACKGG